MLDTPQQVQKHIFQKNIRENFKILCEHIDHRVQGMVARGSHPLWLLQRKVEKKLQKAEITTLKGLQSQYVGRQPFVEADRGIVGYGWFL